MTPLAGGVLMCPPTFYTVRDVKNPFMRPDRAIDREHALQQWLALRETFSALGATPYVVEAADDLEDMVFTANQVFAGEGRQHARFVVPSRMRYASRRREVPHVVAWFVRHGFTVLDLDLGGDAFLEGHGDLLTHPGTSSVWAGYGFRSSETGIERFARAVRAEGLRVEPLRLVDPTFYHLDTCFMPLHAQAALVYPDAFDAASLRALERGWPRLHEVSRDDALRFACNGTVVGNAYVASHVPPALQASLAREALEPKIVNVSEFEKAGGSVFCMKCVVP